MAAMTAGSIGRDEADRLIPAIAADGALEPIGKLDAHRSGVKHLAISAFLFDEEARLLLQRRAAGKYHSPGQWTNSCCTHPDWGEDPDDCARRRLREEIGLDVPLIHRAVVDYSADVGGGLTENERVHVYEAEVDGKATPLNHFDPREVCDLAWWTIGEIAAAMRTEPERFTPWFRIYIDRWRELRLSARVER
jgi:isopentenyl-diphosphate Delta-isomerase